ncbi:hypothetical protein HAX54_029033, partial [Datura stramonium]|nr:hypothetical protein [Datura stramonium]
DSLPYLFVLEFIPVHYLATSDCSMVRELGSEFRRWIASWALIAQVFYVTPAIKWRYVILNRRSAGSSAGLIVVFPGFYLHS